MSAPPPYNQAPPPAGAYPPPQQGGYPPPQGGYPPPQGGYPPPQGGYQPPQPAYAPPPMQSTTNATVVVANTGGVVVGGCPNCRAVGTFNDTYGCCAIFLAIFFFPIGILCCLAMRERQCSNCGYNSG